MQINETSILIVEDEPEILNLLKNIFSKYFSKVYTATNGKRGMEIVKESSPDIVLTDILMPEISGTELIAKMRSEGIDTPVIIISSSRERDDLKKAIKLGVYDFIEKPFKRADVEKVVSRVLEMAVRNNDLPRMIFLYGIHSKEVKQQKKFIGLLHAISAIGSKEIA